MDINEKGWVTCDEWGRVTRPRPPCLVEKRRDEGKNDMHRRQNENMLYPDNAVIWRNIEERKA
uniref:EF-hand domain-containing protein n=1 Tax=Heterorhabditis bacteriophora TaxID=37862 RepID=A0A1I7XT28_HETBA